MKKRILLFTAIAGFAYVTFSSESLGPGNSGWDATGAESGLSNPTGCSATGFSCHGSAGAPTATVGIAIEVDSAGGVPTTHYKGGLTYTVKITGTNGTASTFTGFGLQMTSIKGSTSAATPVNAGMWSATTPAGTHLKNAVAGSFVANIVEHGMKLSPTTGTGGPSSTIVESFTWTAPVAGTGTISFWAAVNCLNNVVGADAGDKWNTNHVVISEWPVVTSVAEVATSLGINAYPNPVVNNLNLQTDNTGTYTVHAFGLNGRCIATEQVSINGTPAGINTSNWAPGFYQVVVEKDGNRQVIPVVKQ